MIERPVEMASHTLTLACTFEREMETTQKTATFCRTKDDGKRGSFVILLPHIGHHRVTKDK